jgi:nucleoid DNA-binding protein
MSVTKNHIALDICKKTKLRHVQVKRIVQMTLDGIIEALAARGRLELRNFGVFQVRARNARKARNPKTGAVVMVPPCRVVTFKAGKILETRIQAPPKETGGNA